MNRALNQLILLGFICQSLSWDGWSLPILSVCLWYGCLKVAARRPVLLSSIAECGLLLAGSAIGILIGQLPDQSAHFFIGHGITLLQAGRLLRSLDKREQLFAMIAATVQLGVACTVVLDYRFIPILLTAAILLPKALMELEGEHFPKPVEWKPRLKFSTKLAIVAVMIGFFLIFPRGLLSSALPALRKGPDNGSLLDSTLDAAGGGAAPSSRVIMQLKGEDVGYLRLFALTAFDGVKWHPDKMPILRGIGSLPESERSAYPHRTIRVKETRNLGKTLPTDGRVVALEGKFFRRPRRTYHEYIACSSLWSSANNIYQYWIDPTPDPQPIYRRYRAPLLRHPRQSERLREWLDQELAGIEEPLEQARTLEQFFLNNFTYEIGAPTLSRLNPIDDFIFNERRGHCERYASAMALLMRMRGIPSRVMLGYVPGKPNWMTGWVNIRASDAHAWAEGWFPDVGWVQFEPTPRATMDLSISPFREFLDALDVVWYVNIVNFDVPAQQGLLTAGVQGLVATASWLKGNIGSVAPVVLLLICMLVWRSRRKNFKAVDPRDARRRTRVLAEHYYGKMLKALARKGIDREPYETPLEFLSSEELRKLPSYPEIRMVTNLFCQTRYGAASINDDDKQRIEKALGQISKRESNR